MNPKNNQDNWQQYHSNQDCQDNFASWMGKVNRPSKAEALGDKRIRIVGVVVYESAQPVPVIVAVNDTGNWTFGGRASPRPAARVR
jgi:hypothetical protein